MGLKKFLRNQDMFGHRVTLNFNKDSDTHKTGCGGFISILIKIVLTLYLILRMKALVMRENNQYTWSDPPTKFEELGEISFEKTKIVPFIQVKKSSNGMLMEFPLEAYQKYMKIQVRNFVPHPKSGRRMTVTQDIRYCDAEDFIGYEYLYKKFTMNGKLKQGLLCFNDTGSLQLKYSNFYKFKEAKTVDLSITQCTGDDCEKDMNKVDQFFKTFYLVFNIIDHNVDFTKYGEAPVKSDYKYISAFQLDRKKLTGGKLPVRRNIINTEDDYFQIGQPAIEHEYFDTNTFQKFTFTPEKSGGNKMYLRIRFIFQLKQLEHSRQCYSFLDLFGDFGGFMEILFSTSDFFISGISQHMFFIKAIQKLYLARTKHQDSFQTSRKAKKLKKKEKINKIIGNLSKEEQQSISKNHVIKISFSQSMKLLIQSYIPCLQFDQQRLWRLYERGQEKIQTEFNLVKIIKNLRNLKIFIKSTSMDPETKIKVQNSDKNCIKIDTDSVEMASSEPEMQVEEEEKEEADVGFSKETELAININQLGPASEFSSNSIINNHGRSRTPKFQLTQTDLLSTAIQKTHSRQKTKKYPI